MFLAAFAALPEPTFRAYDDRKRAQRKKKHNAARICLTRRRCDDLYAMLRDGTLYHAPTTESCLTKGLPREDEEPNVKLGMYTLH